MADKDLSVGIGVDLEVNTKKLDAIAKHIGMTGDKLQEALNFEVDTTSLEILGKEIGALEAKAVSLGVTLAAALGGNPAGQQELISNLRDQLTLANKIKDANAQTAAPRKTGSQVGIKQAIAQELFGDKGVDFNVGAFKSDLQARSKGYLEDLGDDAIDLVDIAADSTKGLLQDINDAAKEAAAQVGVQFKSSTEMLTGFNGLTLEEGADTLAAGLKAVSENIALSGNMIINGQRFAEQDLVQSIRDFEVDSKGVFTISPAMFLDGYRKVIAKLGKDLVTVNSTDYKDLSFKPLEGKAPGQAGQNVVDYMQKTLDDIAAKPGGSAKIDQKLADLEEKIILEILEKARRAGERALKDPNDFNSRMLDTYAPSADTAAIAGSTDTTNLERYADEEAAKVAYQLEQLYGLAEGTIAAYVKVFSQDQGDPNKLFDMVRAAQAIVGSSFTDATGTNVPSATSRGLVSGQGQTIGQQIVSNPAILQNILGVQQEAFDKKVETLLATRIKDQGGLAPGDLEQAIQLALIQSLAGQIARIKISPTEVAKAVAVEAVTASGSTATSAPFSLKDNKALFREIIGREKSLQGSRLAVGVDAEFNEKVEQRITEFSAVFKNAKGQFQKLVDFIQMPLDTAGLASDKTPFGAKSADDLRDRATVLGYNATDIGDTGDVIQNQQVAAQNAKDISDLFAVLAEFKVPITGSNLSGAEAPKIKKFIEYGSNLAEALTGVGIPQPNVLKNTFDSATEYKKLDRNSDLASRLPSTPTGLAETKLQTILSMMAVEFKDLFDQYSSVVRMVQDEAGVDRPEFLSAAGGKMGAHYAQADAIASLIVRELFIKAAPAKDATRALGTAKPGSDGGGKPPADPPSTAAAADDPMGERKATALARAFHSQFEYTKMLSGLTDNEKDVIARRLKMLAENDKQVALSAQLFEKEKAIAEKRASLQGMPISLEWQAVRQEIHLLDGEINDLIQTGRKNEAAIKQQVIEEGRHKDMKEELRDNDRKGLDLEIQKRQAGKQFSAEIKAQVKEQIDAQKALQKANREQINQWVTGRYALYDVGNFYQNFAQQMFRLSRQIFDTTQTYRSFESAFTSVERAMQISGIAASQMRDQFIQLSETLPVTFEDLSKIATLGAQMGIGAGGIKDFTATVAKFSAITTISADTVAQKFGRIAELAKIDSSEFQNLGSAVAFAGVNAVATESEILTLSESIAAVSTQAGLTPPEIVGMSTALASVGIQAEQARGVFTRVFADINRAVSRGGSELDAFAKISGMSSEDFAKQWGTEGQSYNVFRKLLGGLGSSSDATKAFDALNIVETREVNTLTRLAESLGVVDQAISDSNQSFTDGTFLAASFEKTSDDLNSQLIIFKNNIDSLVVSISQTFGPALGNALKIASEFIEILKLASKSGFAQAILPIGFGITAMAGAAGLAVAGFSKLIAQIYAFRVASINSMNSSATDILGPINRIKQLTGAYSGLIEVRSGLKGVGGADVKGLVTPVTYKAGDIVGGQRQAFAELAKTRSLASAKNIMNNTRENALMQSANILMISSNKTQGVSIGLARQQADAVQRIIDARRQEIALLAEKGALEGVSQAERLAEKFYVEITKEGAVAVSQSEYAKLKETSTNGNLAKSERDLAASRLASIRAVNAETQTATKGVKLGLTGMFNRITGLLGSVAIIGTVVSMIDMLRVSIEEANKVDLLGSGGGVQSLRDAISEDTEIWKKTGEAIDTVTTEYTVYEAKTYDAYDAIVAVSGANKNLKKTTDEITEVVKTQTSALGQNTKEWILNSIISNEKVNEWLKSNPGLFKEAQEAVKEYGLTFNGMIEDIMKDPDNASKKIDTMLNGIEQRFRRKQASPYTYAGMSSEEADAYSKKLTAQAAAVAKIRQLVADIAVAIKLGLDTSALRKSLSDAMNVVDEEITGGLQKTVKTLTQWSGEVAQIISSALEIRSQKTTALDGITKAWSDLRKKADDARKAVKKAQDQINMLKANRGTLEYQLNIAIKYGDSKRAAEIQAKLDENTTSLTDANDQLAEAQKTASTELKGNTDAAIDNRATLRSLVNTYVPYIQALENSTVKGETFAQKQDRVAKKVGDLKKEFESQALALGFAQTDLAAYLGDFDAMATIVKKIPNTVTVKIDGLPAALRALKEFASAANTELGKINLDEKAKDAALIKGYDDQISVLKYQAQAVNENKTLSAAGRASSLSIIGNTIRDLVNKMATLRAKVYKASGGYISGAGTGTSDSIPAMLSNGEFVMSAKSVSNYGVDFMNSLNQSRVMYAPAQPSAAQAGGGSSVVYLSPDDRALLRAAIDRPVNLYANGTRLAQSVNDGNKVLAQRGSI